MKLSPPGDDPVADHTWCCEHPEPWHYFVPEAEARLLSGLSRVYRVDPVEAAWSLRIARWAASEAATPVLEAIVLDRALKPSSTKLAASILRDVSEQYSKPTRSEADAAKTGPLAPADILAALARPDSRPRRAQLLAALVDHLEGQPTGGGETLRVLGEVVASRHEASEVLFRRWVDGGADLAMAEQRAQLIMYLGANGERWAIEAMAELIRPAGPLPIYDLYEAVRAASDRNDGIHVPEAQRALRDALHSRHWWPGVSDRDGYGLVVEAALGSEKARKRVLKAGSRWSLTGSRARTTSMRRGLAEAAGYLDDSRSLRLLRRLLTDVGQAVRRDAARSLWRKRTPAATATLLGHLESHVVRGRALLDIEGVEVVRYAIDAAVRDQPAEAPDALARLLEWSGVHLHDLLERTAIALCALGDVRCTRPHPQSTLPSALHAALTPIELAPWESLPDPVITVGGWLIDHYDLDIPKPQGELTHLERVYLSRELLARWRGR